MEIDGKRVYRTKHEKSVGFTSVSFAPAADVVSIEFNGYTILLTTQ